MWSKLGEHVKQYWVIYLTLSCVYLAGVIFGALGVEALGVSEQGQLAKFLDSLLQSQPIALDSRFLEQLARDTFIMMAGIWVLGLTVIGAPLIYLIVFTRGFILGFTVSFFIEAKGLVGLALTLVSVFIPSLLVIPLLLLGAGLATVFSVLLLRGKSNGQSLRGEFLYYSLAAALVSLGAIAAGVTQGYFSLLGVRLFLG